MGIRWTGSRGQLERLRRRQSRQQGENPTEVESQKQIGEAERKPREQVTSLIREVAEGFKPIVTFAGWFVGIIFIGGLAVGIYQRLDQAGWITHKHDTPVWIQGNWMVGEYRNCQMRTKTVAGGDKDLDYLDKLPRLFCGKDANGLFDFQRTNGAVPPPPDQVPPEGAMYLYTVTGDELEQDFHVMPVRYNGRIDRTDKWVISWRCQRLNMGFLESAALECDALN